MEGRTESSDSELLGAVADGDTGALRVLYDRHAPWLSVRLTRRCNDPGLVAELAERGIVLECCPTSNVVLGVFPDFERHPFPALREAGVPLTLGSDDPPYFGATLAGEYEVARTRFGLRDAELRELTRTAIGAAFVQEDVRVRLLDRVGR